MSIASRFLRSSSQESRGLSIEPMRRRHLGDILKIEEQVYPKPWTSGVFSSEIDLARRGERFYIVAKEKNQLVGYAGLMYMVDEAHISNIAVDPQRRREGIGKYLLFQLIEQAIVRGAQALTLEVRASNTSAHALYRIFGFAPAGIRQRYYENTEDALVMWAHDIQSTEYRLRLNALGGGQ